MKTTRRRFITTVSRALALTFAVDTLGSVAFGQKKTDGEIFDVPPEAYSSPLFSMTAKQFESYIGHAFTVVSEEGESANVILTEVNKLERQGNTLRGYYGESYSLIFESRGEVLIPQGTYEITTDGLAAFAALLVPTGRRSRQYELIVNRVTR